MDVRLLLLVFLLQTVCCCCPYNIDWSSDFLSLVFRCRQETKLLRCLVWMLYILIVFVPMEKMCPILYLSQLLCWCLPVWMVGVVWTSVSWLTQSQFTRFVPSFTKASFNLFGNFISHSSWIKSVLSKWLCWNSVCLWERMCMCVHSFLLGGGVVVRYPECAMSAG